MFPKEPRTKDVINDVFKISKKIKIKQTKGVGLMNH